MDGATGAAIGVGVAAAAAGAAAVVSLLRHRVDVDAGKVVPQGLAADLQKPAEPEVYLGRKERRRRVAQIQAHLARVGGKPALAVWKQKRRDNAYTRDLETLLAMGIAGDQADARRKQKAWRDAAPVRAAEKAKRVPRAERRRLKRLEAIATDAARFQGLVIETALPGTPLPA